MAGIRLKPEECPSTTLLQSNLFSDDDRPFAALDYGSDKEEPDADGCSSALGLQSYWDIACAGESTSFREHGHAGEVWFGADVMHMVASWTRNLCVEISRGHLPTNNHFREEPTEDRDKYLCDWNVLDLGTGNGLLLQELANFSDLTGTDYSEGEVDLVRSLSNRDGFTAIKFFT